MRSFAYENMLCSDDVSVGPQHLSPSASGRLFQKSIAERNRGFANRKGQQSHRASVPVVDPIVETLASPLWDINVSSTTTRRVSPVFWPSLSTCMYMPLRLVGPIKPTWLSSSVRDCDQTALLDWDLSAWKHQIKPRQPKSLPNQNGILKT